MKGIFEYTKQAVLVTFSLLVLCGLIYPFAVTGFAQVLFTHQANGSLIEVNDQLVGSQNVGQAFTDPAYFTGRVSSVNYNTYTEEDTVPNESGETAYGGVSSGSFNYAASNPDLKTRIEEDIVKFLEANPDVTREQIPADLLTASGSGLDPHISIQAATIQVSRVAKASGLSVDQVNAIIRANREDQVFGVLGEDKMNVLGANIDIFKEISE